MQKMLLALGALLASTAAQADTLISNVNGITVDDQSRIQHFTGLLIGHDGKVVRLLNGPAPAARNRKVVDFGGRTVLPGLIDAHGHVTDLGFTALRLNLTGTKSLAELQQRLRD